MYEPKYLPQLKESFCDLSSVRFSLLHGADYVRPDDLKADPLHVHNYLEIFFNVSSDVSFLVNNKLYPVPTGCAIVSCPNDVHVCIYNKSAVHEHFCLWIDADQNSPVFDFFKKPNFSPYFGFDDITSKQVSSLLFSLLSAIEKGGTELEKTALVMQILCFFENGKTANEKQSAIPETLQNILDDINKNFARIKSVNEVLRSYFVSSATLTRWFRKYLHSSPREYLESVRLSNAMSLLSSGASVTDACIWSGFSDCSHFIVLFKKRYGTTPLKYKKDNFS